MKTYTKIDVLHDAKAEVACVAEVLSLELVLLHLQATLQNLHGLVPPDGHVNANLLVTTNAK